MSGDIAKKVSCAGIQVWEWPTGVALEPEAVDAPEGRILSGQYPSCGEYFDACTTECQPSFFNRGCSGSEYKQCWTDYDECSASAVSRRG